jgi:hypothetical protein
MGWDRRSCLKRTKDYSSWWCLIWLGGNFVRLGRNYRGGCMSRMLSE